MHAWHDIVVVAWAPTVVGLKYERIRSGGILAPGISVPRRISARYILCIISRHRQRNLPDGPESGACGHQPE
jgi:hypothetical protein